MSILYRFSALAAGALLTAGAYCAIPEGRVFYGFSAGGYDFPDEEKRNIHGFAAYPFDTSVEGATLQGELLDSYDANPSAGVCAGAGVNGLIYACEYETCGLLGDEKAGSLVVYNTFNGTKKSIAQWQPDDSDLRINDMTWSRKDGKMYATVTYQNQNHLYEVNLTTGRLKYMCTIRNGGATLAAAADGTLYSLNWAGVLYTLHPVNGRATIVFDTGLGNLTGHQSMEFDMATGLLYWVSKTDAHPFSGTVSWLQEIDPVKKTICEIGSVGATNGISALHIPSAQSLLSPAAPTDVKIVPSPDSVSIARLSWKAPEKNLDGNPSSDPLLSYIITRNGEQQAIMTSTGNPFSGGDHMEWTDSSSLAPGTYRYDITFHNSNGAGASGTVFRYVGPDIPGTVRDIKGELSQDTGALRLSWNPPLSGLNNGDFDAATVRYTVRRSDNRVVARDLEECVAHDTDFPDIARYSYTVTAANDTGSSESTSMGFVTGTPFSLPYKQPIETTAPELDLWSSSSGWLITPPLLFEAGKDYELTISTRSDCHGEVEVYSGNLNIPSSMDMRIGEMEITKKEHDPWESDEEEYYHRTSLIIPALTEEGIHYIGLRTKTLLPSSENMTINGIFIGHPGEFSGIPTPEKERPEPRISLKEGVLIIEGDFHCAELFDISGRKAAVTTSRETDLNNFPSGVYVLNIDGRSFKIAL